MRVRPNRNATEPRRRSGTLRRRHAHERRARESGGPEDHAMYTCTCGYVFQAKVSTSVACPHCGAGQAW